MEQGDPKNPIRPLPGFLPDVSGAHKQLDVTKSRAMRYGLDGGNAYEGPAEIPLREYLRVVFKYRMIIAAAGILGTVLALIYSFTAVPRYTAKSTIRISTYEPVLSQTKIEDILEEKSKESNYLETQIEELKSFSLADRVLQDPGLRAYFDHELGIKPGVTGNPSSDGALGTYKTSIREIRAYLDRIEISPVRRTSLVAIEATSEDPSIAATIAHRHALTFIDWVRDLRVEQQSRALQFLRQQADELREKVADLEREMADYAEANSIVAVNKDENIVAQKMSQLNQLMTEITSKRLEAENDYREADAALSSNSAGMDDVSTQGMRTDLSKLESEYQELSAKFLPGYPRMVQLKSQIDGLKATILVQRTQIVTGLKSKAAALADQEKNMQEELEQQKSHAFELSKKQVQYNSLNRELTSSRDLLENVLKQIKETGLSVESNSSNVSIVDIPIVPQSPSFPRKRLLVCCGMFLGLIVGLAIAFVLNYIDNSIKTPEEVVAYLKLPNLGVVPSFELERLLGTADSADVGAPAKGVGRAAEKTEPAIIEKGALIAKSETNTDVLPVVFLKNPRSLAAEAYRTIRTGILLSQAGEPPRTILVTSAQSSEGKTTSSVNLAASLASSGARVVLIDADLRRPSVHRHFKLESNLPGLVEIITGQRHFEDVAIRDLIKRITVVPAGRIPPNPAELLGSYEMLSLLERLAGEFDYVVVDSPPILPVTDSVVLSRFVDGVVLVVRGGSTPRKVVADAKNRLLAVGSRLLGTVLNDVDITGGDYYYYNRYYHSYYRREGEQSARDSAMM